MDKKLSYYLEYVESINAKNDTLLYSSRTTKKTVVSNKVWQYLKEDKIGQLPSKIVGKLYEQKILVDSQEDELSKILSENNAHIAKSSSLYEVIQPSAYCQMGCYYCGQEHKNVNINSDLIFQIAERIERKLNTNEYRSLLIGWFGGEPLIALKEMNKLTQIFKDICYKKGIKYSSKVVTNGLLLTKKNIINLVEDLGVFEIEITLDGTEEDHDSHRFLKTGGGTFDKIYKNLLGLIQVKKERGYNTLINVRCNVDIHNTKSVKKLLKLFKKDNLLKEINFYATSIYEWGDKINEDKYEKDEYARLELNYLFDMLESEYNISGALIPKRKKNVCLTTKKGSEVYDAYGNRYNCTEIPYTPGAEHSKFTNNSNQSSYMANWNDYILEDNNIPCSSCKFLPTCGGGCPKQWLEGNIPCPPFKFTSKERLLLFYKLSQLKEVNNNSIKKLRKEFAI